MINKYGVDYGQCDRCGYRLIQYNSDGMCIVCELTEETLWHLRHKDD